MDKEAYAALKYGAIAGAIVVLLWIIYNGIDEGFKATPREMLGYIAVLILLALNAALLSREFAKYFTAAGNVLFSLWFAYDGITRASQLTSPGAISHVVLIILLALSSFLLLRRESNGTNPA
jgi:hypothetical protein